MRGNEPRSDTLSHSDDTGPGGWPGDPGKMLDYETGLP